MSAGGKSAGNLNYQEKSTSGEQNGYFSNIEVYQSAIFYCDVTFKGSLILSAPLPIISGGTGLTAVGAVGKALFSTGSALTYSEVVTSVTLDTASVPFIFVNSSTRSTITNTGTFTLTANTTGTGNFVVLQTSPILKTNVGLLSAANSSLLTLQPSSDTSAYTWIFPSTIGSTGQLLVSQGLGNQLVWVTPGTFGVGTVTSVSQTVPSFLSITGSPITSSGTLAITLSGVPLPISSGGTGLTTTGSAGQILTSNGTSLYYNSNVETNRIEIDSTICADASASQAATIKGAIYNKGGLYMDKNFYIQGDYLEPFDSGGIIQIKDMNVIKSPVLSSTYPVQYLGAASFTIDGNPVAGTNVSFTGGGLTEIAPTNVALHVKGSTYMQGLNFVTGSFTVLGSTDLKGSNTFGTSFAPYIASTTLLGDVTFGTNFYINPIDYNTSNVDFVRSNISIDKHSILKFSGIATSQTLYIGQDLNSTNSYLPSIIFQGFTNSEPLLTISVLEEAVPNNSEPRITFGNLTNYSMDIIDGNSFYGTRFRHKVSKNRNLDIGVSISGNNYIPQVKMITTNGNILTMTSDSTAARLMWTVSSTTVFEMGVTNDQNLPFLKMTKSNGKSFTMTSDSVAQRLIWQVSSNSVFEMGVGDMPYFKIEGGISNHLNSSSRWCEDDASQVKVVISKTGIKVGIDEASSSLLTDGGIDCVYINVDNNLKVVGNIYVGPKDTPKITMNATGSISSVSLSTTENVTVGGTLSVTGTSSFAKALSTTEGVTVGGTLSVTGTSSFSGALSTTAGVTVGGTLSVTGTSSFSGSISTTAGVTVGGTLSVTSGNISVGTGSISAASLSATGLISGGSLSITGSAATGPFRVTGLSSFTGAVTITGSATVTSLTSGNVTITGLLNVAGNTSITGALTVNVGVTTFNGLLNINGITTVISPVFVTGAVTILGALTTTGGVIFNGITAINAACAITGTLTMTGVGASFTFPSLGVFAVSTLGGLISLAAGAGGILLSTAAGIINLTTGVGSINLTTLSGGIGLYCNSGIGDTITIQNSTSGNTQITCGAGNIQLNSNNGAIDIGAGEGGINIGDEDNFRLGRFHVKTSNGAFGFATGNVLIETLTQGDYTGPGNININTLRAYSGKITIASKSRFVIESQDDLIVNAVKGCTLIGPFFTRRQIHTLPATLNGTIILDGIIILNKQSMQTIIYTGNTSSSITQITRLPEIINNVDTVSFIEGSTFTFYNQSILPVTIQSYSGSMVVIIQPNTVVSVMLMNFSTWLPTLLSGGGTVTSVAVTVPSFMSVSGSPITTSGTIAISATSTGTGAVVLQNSPELAGVRIYNNGLFVSGTPSMTYQGAGIGWNYTGGQGETNFYNNNANGGVAGGWTWIPTTNTTIGAPVMSLSQTGNLTLVGNIRAENLSWGSNYFGNLSWNLSGGSGEIVITNSYPSAEWHTIFYKHTGTPILRVGANGELVSSNITAQTSSGEDILKLFNTAQANTIITIGRDNNTGNCAQIYTSYIGNNDPSNSFTIAFGGKSPNAQFYNNFSSKFFGPVTVENSSFSYTDATFTIRNTSDRPRLSMALLGPNLLIDEGIFSIHGKDTGVGNCMVTTYVHVSDNNAFNAYNFGFNGKSNNLVLKNDLSSSFGGKLEVAGGVRIYNGLHLNNGTPDMSYQGAGIGWNYNSGQGETVFFNNNANGNAAGGWSWRPTTNTTIGAPVMSLSQTGNLTLAGAISASNLTNGTVTSVAVTVPSFMTVTGSPITTSGTCTINYRNYCHQCYLYWNWSRCSTNISCFYWNYIS